MSFIPYPDIKDDDFQDRIFWKKEFMKTMYPTDFQYSKTEDLCRKGEFRMQYHQEFIRNFISPETPYNGALLFHGTGVGKTCAAIGTTEGLRDYVHKNGKKIYILSSENIRPNFYKELYDADREKVERDIHAIPGSFQCAGDRYYMDFHKSEVKEKSIKDMIKQYYVFKGFGQFANFVDVELGAELPEHMDKPKMTLENGDRIDIGDYFSNSVIVIDEAHGIAGEDKSSRNKEDDSDNDSGDEGAEETEEEKSKPKPKTKSKSTLKIRIKGKDKTKGDKAPRNVSKRSLFEVLIKSIIPACRAKGGKLKILLLTATPMKDDVRELGNLLQLLNANDGREMPDWKEKIFPRGMMKYRNLSESFTPEQEAELIKYAKGYVSYVKGDNPITFPIPLLPPADQLYEPGRRFSDEINPIFAYNVDDFVNIQDKYDIVNPENFKFNLVKCEMDWYQFLCYKALINQQIPNSSLSSDTYPRMISNMAFPIVSAKITPYHIIENPDLLKAESEGGILGNPTVGAGKKSLKSIRAVHGNRGFQYVFPSVSQIVPGTENNINPKKYVSYNINPDIWQTCGLFMTIKEDGMEYKNEYDLSMFSKKLDMLVRNINNSPGIAYVYSEFVETGALLAAIALESNGYVRYHPNIKNYIDSTTGLPKKSLRNSLPECFLLNLSDDKLSTLPDKNYRCAVCGNLYNECSKSQEHKFILATYVVVTGAQGGIKEISEAVTDNTKGHKIKVVIGTKVTGTGVDFKWVRQVHILDPWHNNTRIFQAIGRGLRHCSHADLPKADRNVTIFKYVSTTNVDPILANDIDIYDINDLNKNITIYDDLELNITYKDLLTETVDEHMYHRVIRKDLIIKLIERVLKKIAMDCEFNKNRNMFPGAIDYSRECDYMKCAYTCEGFKDPIRYIRRIRKYNNNKYSYIDGDDREIEVDEFAFTTLLSIDPLTNEEFWSFHEAKNKLVEGVNYLELILDIPIPGTFTFDSSTYNIHFSEPQIDKAVKLINSLFQKTQALKLDKITYLIKKLHPEMEEEFIYSALDKIVGNPPYVKPMYVIDKYGRRGKIIVHNKIYIYQPLEITDLRIPMSYRSKPLSIKNKFYNIDKITAKKVKKTVTEVSSVDPKKIRDIITELDSINVVSVIDILTIHKKLYGYLLTEISELLTVMVEDYFKKTLNSTNIQYVIEYCLQSGMAFFLPFAEDKSILSLLDETATRKRGLLHIMKYQVTANQASDSITLLSKSDIKYNTDIMLFIGKSWNIHNIDNMPDGIKFYDYGDANDSDYPEIYYPHSEMSGLFDNTPRMLLSKINDSSELYLDMKGIYGMMSQPIHRTSQPIFSNSTIRNILFNAVVDYNKQYPNHVVLKECQLKIFDQNKRNEKTWTKADKLSERGEIKGKVCTSATSDDTFEWLRYIVAVAENPENYALISANYDGSKLEFFNDLGISGTVDENDTFTVIKSSNKTTQCELISKLLIILNYFNINNVKWILNPIDVFIYRPLKKK